MNGYRIVGQRNRGISGYAKGGAVVRLTDSDGGTLLTYAAKAGSAQARVARCSPDPSHFEEASRPILLVFCR